MLLQVCFFCLMLSKTGFKEKNAKTFYLISSVQCQASSLFGTGFAFGNHVLINVLNTQILMFSTCLDPQSAIFQHCQDYLQIARNCKIGALLGHDASLESRGSMISCLRESSVFRYLDTSSPWLSIQCPMWVCEGFPSLRAHFQHIFRFQWPAGASSCIELFVLLFFPYCSSFFTIFPRFFQDFRGWVDFTTIYKTYQVVFPRLWGVFCTNLHFR